MMRALRTEEWVFVGPLAGGPPYYKAQITKITQHHYHVTTSSNRFRLKDGTCTTGGHRIWPVELGESWRPGRTAQAARSEGSAYRG